MLPGVEEPTVTDVRCTLRADLREALGERAVAAFSIGPDGEAVVFAVEADAIGRVLEKVNAPGGPRFAVSRVRAGYDAWAIRHTGLAYRRRELRDVVVACPLVQPLPDDTWLVVGARCQAGSDGALEPNAFVHGADGAPARAFALGDGIRDVSVTRDGDVWVSYFDEGVFAGDGVTPAVGAPGIVRFDTDGRVRWAFRPPPDGPSIDDCYAMNVTADAVWAYHYSDFPLVRIDGRGAVRSWPSGVQGASAIAVDGDHVVFAGGYDVAWTDITCKVLGETSLGAARGARLRSPTGDDFSSDARLCGRGAELHVLDRGVWSSVRVADVAAVAREGF